LVVSRGPKATPFQDPRASAGGPTLVIIPEWKTPDPALYTRGIALVGVATRRPGPEVQDPRINSLSKHNCIQACREAAALGGDEGIMLDPHGSVSTCNSTHFFHVVAGEVRTSTGRYCLGGITRQAILRLCHEAGIACREADFPLAALREVEEAFVTGTFGGVTPARSIDSRALPVPGPVTAQVRELYERMLEQA
jgi:branched-chain amino acid aminotransferase